MTVNRRLDVRSVVHFGLACTVAATSACARSRAPGLPAPASVAGNAIALPPVPLVDGPLAVRIVYPPANSTIQSRDSNFIFGTVGSGKATLTINGTVVPVVPNGSFLAFLPVPPASDPRYTIVAARGADTARAVHQVKLLPPRLVLADTGRLVVDSGSISPRGARIARADERLRVSLRAPRNATVTLRLADGSEHALVNNARSLDSARVPGAGALDPYFWSTDVAAASLVTGASVGVRRGADSARFTIRDVAVDDPGRPRWARLTGGGAVPDTDRVIILRPVPNGTYKWLLLPGTTLEATGRIGDMVRLRLDAGLEAWAAAGDLTELPLGTAGPRRTAGNARVVSAPEWTDVIIPTGEPPAFEIREEGTTLVGVLYGTQANTDIINYASADSLVRRVRWYQETTDRARFEIDLAAAPFGYLPMWSRGAFTLRIRKRPAIDVKQPLRGLIIAVNAGHPPAGSTGPTGLYEPVPTLAISQRLKTILEARGARVVMTRTTAEPLALAIRPVLARQAGAHAFISIHLNALPDGVNPFTAHGTGSYYFHPSGEALAREVQRGMVRRMGLRDLGINYDNLSDLRHPWMPSVLTEGAFIMIPEQEAAVKTPEFQERYALGVAEGIEAYFRALGRQP
ncbi:MAG TPA: N-acetylmuramoyl-L-alanine amidase [Gemmatimonadaceae bacterium]|nr:N-acetylmuramoyl-L-alanine amidase [Gemmatimonadaceae bacterium]